LRLETVMMTRKRRLFGGVVLFYVLWSFGHTVFSAVSRAKQQQAAAQQVSQAFEQNGKRETEFTRQDIQNLTRQPVHIPPPPQASEPKKPSGQKMPAPAVVKRLRQVNAFGVVASRERLLHCTDNPGVWDYTCVFHGDPINSATWVQFGVLVDKAHIIEMSETYPAGAPLPPPLTLASR